MSDLKVILTILGLAVLIAFVYALFTLGLAWVIGRKGDETDFFVSAWFNGGILFITLAVVYAKQIGLLWRRMVKEKMIKNITQENFGILAICAIRYCQGRQSYMPDLVRKIVIPHLPDISDKDLGVMINDCEFQKDMSLYGDERIDKPGWLRWKELLLAEKERRNGDI